MRRVALALTVAAVASAALPAVAGPTSRDWRTWPFSRMSPWNMPIGSDAQYVNIPASRNWSIALVNHYGKWASSVAVARPSDPVVDVLINRNRWHSNFDFLTAGGRNCGNTWSTESVIREWANDPHAEYYPLNPWSTANHSNDSDWQFPDPPVFTEPARVGGFRVHKPAGHCPSPDRDGHMAIFQPDGRVLDTYATIVLGDGDIVAHRLATMVDARGTGTAWANGRRASMVPTFAGLIRDGEIQSGEIRHALSASAGAFMLRREVRWPAFAQDRISGYSGQLPMGSLLAIPRNVDLSRLGLSRQGLAIARALQNYGLYVVDRGGDGGFTIKSDSRTALSGWPGMWDDQAIIRNHLRWVVNNSHTNLGGGGLRTAAMAPPFADGVRGRPEYDRPYPARTIFIDSGSDWSYIDPSGDPWWHDQWYSGGVNRTRRSFTIADTVDDYIYQTSRVGITGYRIPLRRGNYTVKLHFAETDPEVRSAGRRVMTANVEGRVRTGIDPYRRAGGRNIAVIETFSDVPVRDGFLNIGLNRTASMPTQLEGVEIVPTDVPTVDMTITASVTSGTAPLWVNFNAYPSGCEGTGCATMWEFGNGAMDWGRTVWRRFDTPGLHTVLATTTANGQAARAVVDITVR